ncbi:flagellar biosynthesis protein FlgC [Desulfopila sp. IMCC35006]|uniref:flagellar basal body rod C-terminal domain-containing protein n=1 Tax=Desulfopila sp. IMCC35006 TaxID=2569542 RepID=UPI0010ACDF29|nr:flagellar basal body rod C-terminal domain-containing protein [Desulfopila sp. IMCC35006]TKB23548.1 flagellar biosynthesis protein FlgC [Desulfopila sp. IMCC35006]
MITASQTALTGLQAFGTKLQANGNNIANANTDGFKKTQITNAAVVPSGVKTVTQKSATPGTSILQQTGTEMEQVELSNVDLATEIVDMSLNSTMYKANLKTIETANEMTGTLLHLKS